MVASAGRKIVAHYEPVNLARGTVGVESICATLNGGRIGHVTLAVTRA